MRQPDLDVIVVGSGPNGLAAAVTLARAGLRVRVYERADHPGGGVATRELTLPGFRHDVCSAVHPLALESRFFREFGLVERVEFATPDLSFAHPLDHGGLLSPTATSIARATSSARTAPRTTRSCARSWSA